MKYLKNYEQFEGNVMCGPTTVFTLGVGINPVTNIRGAKAAIKILTFCEENDIKVTAKTEVIGMGKKAVYSFHFENENIPNFLHNINQPFGVGRNFRFLADFKQNDQVLTDLDNLLISLIDGN